MKKINIVLLIIIISSFFSINIYANTMYDSQTEVMTEEVDLSQITDYTYSKQLSDWKAEGLSSQIAFQNTVSPHELEFSENGILTKASNNYQAFTESIDDYVIAFEEDEVDTYVSFEVNTPEKGLYTISLDYYSLTQTINPIYLEVLINDEIQYYEASQIVLNTLWETPTEFLSDRYGNDTMPSASQSYQWINSYIRDTARVQPEPLLFMLQEGENKITINIKDQLLMLGQIYIGPQVSYPSYQSYIESKDVTDNDNDNLYTIQAENPSLKNSVSIRFGTDNEPSVTPFEITSNKLNIIDGDSYNDSGQAIYYNVSILQPGWYEITLKAKNTKSNSIVYRTLTIDGKVPFEEALNIPFNYSRKWENHTLKTIDDEVIKIYLEQGEHEIGLIANSALFLDIYETVSYVMTSINDLALDIKKLTGNNIDEDREWDIVSFMPHIEDDLYRYATMLEESYKYWQDLNRTTKSSEVSAGLKLAYEWLYELSEKPNDIPKKLEKLATGSNSIMQRLGVILPLIINTPLDIDVVYIHGVDATLPRARANFFVRIWTGIKKFFYSFKTVDNQDVEEDEIEVWVNRSRQYVNLMQQMIDQDFTPESGIKVKISLMASEDKLILSTSSGANPDIAMGVAGWRPYDFAIREAAYDLSSFDDFRSVSNRFYEGAFTQLIYQDGVYGLPETQNFYLLFYRTDIIDALDLEVPQTWQDVVDVLPELQRFGMNFYSQLSSTSSFKGFVSTMPYINQFGGAIYAEDVLSSTLDDAQTIEAIKFMTDLYNIYSLPLEIGSFFNEFRYGNLPMGIGDFGMYIQLLNAAPEIAGLWDIALLPGVENEDGVIDRSYDGASTSAMIFDNSDKKDESWEFLKWWTETETQVAYSENLINALGPEYMWNTSNYEAFKQLSWNRQHQDVFLEQWTWVFDTAKTPASYMLEREISNVWNKVVYDGENVRTAIEDATIIIDKEITRKMIEFEFINSQGDVIKAYILPTKESLSDWVGDSGA